MKPLVSLLMISLLALTGHRRGCDSPRRRGYWLIAGILIGSVPCLMAQWLPGGDAIYFALTMVSAGIAYGLAVEYGSRNGSMVTHSGPEVGQP